MAARLSDQKFILLAEDNEGDVYLAKRALQDHGLHHEVRVLEDGEEAFDFIDMMEAASDAPDVVLMLLDLHLPRKDGIDVLRRLRSGRRGALIPVMVLTSSDAPYDRESAETFEGVHFFRKPSALDEYMVLGATARSLIVEREANARVAIAGVVSIDI